MSNRPILYLRRAFGVSAALVLALCNAACPRPANEDTHPEVTARLIQNASLEIFSTDHIANSRTLNEFIVDHDTIKTFWRTERMETVANASQDRGVVLRVAGHNAFFTADVDLRAADVAAIEAVGEGMVGKSTLMWVVRRTVSPTLDTIPLHFSDLTPLPYSM